jgi:AcrR family transcriptional regulator
MANQRKRRTAPRLPLSRDRVLRTGLELADRDGIDSLSMRRLGTALGVEAMSLYNHVANKEDLLDGLADIAVGEIEVPTDGVDWKVAMRRRAVSAREMLSRHPWAGGVIESRTSPSPTRLRYANAVVGSLRQGGFAIDMAIHAFFTLDSYIYGFAVQEQNLPAGTPEELARVGESMLSTVPAAEYPYLREVLEDHVLALGFDYETEFEFGLDLLLDALERARDGGRVRSPQPA